MIMWRQIVTACMRTKADALVSVITYCITGKVTACVNIYHFSKRNVFSQESDLNMLLRFVGWLPFHHKTL